HMGPSDCYLDDAGAQSSCSWSWRPRRWRAGTACRRDDINCSSILERVPCPMCRNVKRLRHPDHAPTDAELHDAALQFVRKISGSNPFASASPLLYQAPPCNRIHDADYQPAVEEGMRRQLAEVEGIASDTAAPSFDNTIVALERSGALLTRAFKVFIAMTQANTDDTLQRIQTEEAPRLAAHLDAIHLNDSLFRRVRSVHERRADLGLDSVQPFLVERYYRDFVRAGALLAEPDKVRLRALNQEESKLATDFQNRLLAATKSGAVVV